MCFGKKLFLVMLWVLWPVAIAGPIVADESLLLIKDRHLINDVAFSVSDKVINAVVEIPAGTSQKWEVDKISGQIEWEKRKGKYRVIDFLAYPGNYGFIPQTYQSVAMGGDGDPLDVLILGESLPRGTVVEVRILGSLKLLDGGEIDDKYIAIPMNSTLFKKVKDLDDALIKYPGSIEIVRTWFEGYKEPGKIQFMGYSTRKRAMNNIHLGHSEWIKAFGPSS